MVNNPAHRDSQSRKSMLSASGMDVGEVVEVKEHKNGDKNRHVFEVAPYRGKTDIAERIKARMVVPARGDVNPPTVGSLVVIAYQKNDMAVIVGCVYEGEPSSDRNFPYTNAVSESTPPYKEGERKIGHPLSLTNIYFNEKGELIFSHETGSEIRLLEGGEIELQDFDGTKVKLDNTGNIDITADGKGTINLNGDFDLDADNVTLTGGGTVDVTGSSQVTVDSSTKVVLGGSSGNAVARKGDSVEVTDSNGNTLTGSITGGSSNVDSN